MTDVKPCPFCGSANISDGESLTENRDGSSRWTQSECQDCGAVGPAAKLARDEIDFGCVKAIAAWNRRSMTPAGMSEPTDEQIDAILIERIYDGDRETAEANDWCAEVGRPLARAILKALTPPAVVPEPARQSVLDEVRRAIRALWGVAPGPHAILDLADVESVLDRLAAPAMSEPAPSYPAVPPSEEKK